MPAGYERGPVVGGCDLDHGQTRLCRRCDATAGTPQMTSYARTGVSRDCTGPEECGAWAVPRTE
ncbi:hypothetical protein ACIBO6_28910 [Streptomyces luteogriseus]|uniref:hypothetical protein n=1 Tax=Streptomyces luteogriseus TaxID=68233 RepID=UPI0037973D90